jgi:hypothetical protein
MENKLSHDKPLVIFVTTFVVIMAWRNTPEPIFLVMCDPSMNEL